MKFNFKFLAALGLLFLLGCNSPKTTKAPDEFSPEAPRASETVEGKYYIAIAAPLTGPYKELGKTIVEGVNLAIEEFNLNQDASHKIGSIVLDDGGLVSEGLGRADIAIAQGVLGVIGHLNSEISVEVSRKYAAAKIPQISPASTHPKFTEQDSVRGFVFRTIGTDKQLGEAAAKFAINGGYKKIAVVYNDKPYGLSVSSEFTRRLPTACKLLLYESIPVRTTDHSQTVAKLDKLNPDLVFFVGEYNDAGYLLKELKSRVPKAQFLSVEGVHNPAFIQIAGEAAEGAVIISTGISPDLQDRYKARYKREATGYIGSSYLATKILLEAAKANSYKSGSGLSRRLLASGYFNPNGDIKTPKFISYKVVNSQFQAQP